MLWSAARGVVTLLVAVSLVVSTVGWTGVAASPSASRSRETGRIEGTAKSPDQAVLAFFTVRLREVSSGELVAVGQTNEVGAFLFTGLNPGTYVVEVVDATGRVLATSVSIPLAEGATISGVTLQATAYQAVAAGGGLGGFFTSSVGWIVLAAVGTGVATLAVVSTLDEASGSR